MFCPYPLFSKFFLAFFYPPTNWNLRSLLRENTPVSNKYPEQPDDEQMRRVVDIEKPLHAFPFSSFPVILLQNRQRQQCAHLENSVGFVHKDKVYGCIDDSPYQ